MSIQTLINKVTTKVSTWLNKQEKSFLKIEQQLSPLVQDAMAVSNTLDAFMGDTGQASHADNLRKIEQFLGTIVKDAALIAEFMAMAQGMPLPTLLLNAASFALGFFKPGHENLPLLSIQTALQIARQIFANDNPGRAGRSTVMALLAAPAR